MPPLAASSQHRAPLPGPRMWLLAGTGALAAGVIVSFLWKEGRQPAELLSQPPSLLPHSSPAFAAKSAPPLSIHAQFASSATANAQITDGPAWSEAEKERIRIWARGAPRAAADWATILPPGPNRRFVVETAALAWSGSDPSSAVQWAQSLLDDAERTLALTDIAGEAVRSAPLLAIEIARTLSDTARAEILPRAASEWAMQEPAAAADWARKISGESLRASVLASIATVWSVQEPASAADLAVNELPPGRLQANTIVSIVQRWAQQSPADAQAWVDQFPQGDLKAASEAALSSRQP